jgi:hypothetical protein
MFNWIRKLSKSIADEQNEQEDSLERRVRGRFYEVRDTNREDIEIMIAADIIEIVRRHDKNHRWNQL